MYVLDNVPLASYSTMQLGGTAAHAIEIHSRRDVSDAVAWAKEKGFPTIAVGAGSNIIWKDDRFEGVLLVNKIMGFENFEEDADNLYVTVASGESWDTVVERTVALGKSGIEELSLIPGTVGGAPVQNIGAYGRELAETLVSVECYDTKGKTFLNIPVNECKFGYRTSRFKSGEDRDRFFITGITLHLTSPQNNGKRYERLSQYLEEHNISNPTPSDIRNAVIDIRNSKLPNPKEVPNTGSFFANPIINSVKYQEIIDNFPELARWPSRCFWSLPDGNYKVAAAALIEYVGFKDFHDPETGMATWKNQALVLVNENAKTTADLLSFKQKIVDKIQQTFGIALEQEPELLP